ncbi:MAG: CoA-binding protein [Desulfovibrionaceae bacterium]
MAGCELPLDNATDADVQRILASAKTVAVVGLSPKPERDSNRVAAYMIQAGFDVVGVNPGFKEILGRPCYRDMASVPGKIDIVNIFRKPEAIPPVVDQAIEAGASCVWMQLGLAHNQAADKARAAGMDVVMNKCIMVEHRKLFPGG